MHREIDLRRGSRVDAEELWRRHPDYGERHIVDENLLPGRACGIAEALLAVAQAQDCHRRGASAIVVGKDQAARRRRHRETAKEVAGDVLALGELRLTFDHHIQPASRFVREEAGQDWRRHFAQALERRKREDGCRNVRTVAVWYCRPRSASRTRSPWRSWGRLCHFTATSEVGSETGSERNRIESMKL